MTDQSVVTFTYAVIAVAGTGNYTLSASEYANKAIKFTGILTGNRTIIVPTSLREYIVNNATTGAFSLTVKTLAGTGIAVTQAKSAFLYCDGTDVVASETDEGAGIATPVSIANGGTGQTTAGAALTALGGTATGVSVFTAANAAAARSAIGAVALGDANVFTEPQSITKNDAVTNTVTDLLTLTHSTSGTAAASFGAGLVYKLEDAAGNIETVASIDAVLTDATNGSEDAVFSFKTMIAGAAKTEVFRIGAGVYAFGSTGGDKGIGTINAVNYYINGTLHDGATTTDALTGTNTAKFMTADATAALWEKGSDIASAGAVSFDEGGYVHITGTTTITDLDFTTAKDGRKIKVIFDGILTLTHNATTLKLPGNANITTAAGDRAEFVQDSSDNVICLWYTRADGTAVVVNSDSMALLATLTTTSGTAHSATGLSPASYKYYFVDVRGVSFTGLNAIDVAASGNNGANYGTAQTISSQYKLLEIH